MNQRSVSVSEDQEQVYRLGEVSITASVCCSQGHFEVFKSFNVFSCHIKQMTTDLISNNFFTTTKKPIPVPPAVP